MQQQVAVRQGVTCDKGDELVLRTAARMRAPYNGVLAIGCNLCGRNADVRQGYYTCKNADTNCDFDCCPTCFKG